MNRDELATFIYKHKESDDFTGIDETLVNIVQSELGLKLPESYKWFLTNYGSGGLFISRSYSKLNAKPPFN